MHVGEGMHGFAEFGAEAVELFENSELRFAGKVGGHVLVETRVAFDIVEGFEHSGIVLCFEEFVEAVFGRGETGGIGGGHVEFISCAGVDGIGGVGTGDFLCEMGLGGLQAEGLLLHLLLLGGVGEMWWRRRWWWWWWLLKKRCVEGTHRRGCHERVVE